MNMKPDETRKSFSNFLRLTTIFSIAMLALFFISKEWIPGIPLNDSLPLMILFFMLVTNLVYYYQLKASTAKGSKFINIFMATTGFRLIFFLVIIVVYALVIRDDVVNFIIDFFILYVLFTSVEVFKIKSFINRELPK